MTRELVAPPKAPTTRPAVAAGPQTRPRGKASVIVQRAAVIGIVVVLFIAILLPLVRLLTTGFAPNGEFTFDVVTDVFGARWFPDALRNTLIVVGCSAASAVVIAALLAWANERTDAAIGWFGQILPLIPLVVPGMVLATGWLMLGAPRVGLLQRPLEQLPWLDAFIPDLHSMPGLIFVLTLTLVPFPFLVIQNALRNVDPALEEASVMAGAGVWRTVWRVSLPSVKHAILGGALLAVIVGIAEYSVPLIIGTPARLDILSVHTVRFVTASYPAQLGEGSVMGLFMLLVTGSLWFVYFKVSKGGRFSQLGGKASKASLMKLGWAKWPVRAVMVIFFLCSAALPLFALLLVALQPYWTPVIDITQLGFGNFQQVLQSDNLGGAIANSALYATIGATIAVVVVGMLTTSVSIRRSRFAEVGLGVMKVPAAISSVVLAIGFVMAFYGAPFHLGGTMVLLIGAYVINYLPYASILAESAVAQVRKDLVESSNVAGASEWRTRMRIVVPLALPGFIGAFALLFAMMAGEATMSRVLAQPGTQVAGFAILQTYEVGSFSQLAVMGALIAGLILVVVASLLGVSRLLRRRW